MFPPLIVMEVTMSSKEKMQLRPSDVQKLWSYMCDLYGVSIVQKQGVKFWKILSAFARFGNMIGLGKFMKNWAVYFRKKIYLPYYVGSTAGGWTLFDQVVNCAHEFGHAEQEEKEGIRFWYKYIVSPSKRAGYEAKVNLSYYELYQWMYGYIPDDSKERAEKMEYYLATSTDIDVTERSFLMHSFAIRNGARYTRQAKEVIEYLEGLMDNRRHRGSNLCH